MACRSEFSGQCEKSGVYKRPIEKRRRKERERQGVKEARERSTKQCDEPPGGRPGAQRCGAMGLRWRRGRFERGKGTIGIVGGASVRQHVL